jgi:hypothetical protein
LKVEIQHKILTFIKLLKKINNLAGYKVN